jgi:DNA-binding NarL/FixJ family response regulator
MECAQLVEQNPDIDLVSLLSSPTQLGTWMGLSRSDVAVIDDDIIRREGVETLRVLLACHPALKFLVIMENYNEGRMLWAVLQGVRGVMLQREVLQLLGKAIRQINEGEVWMPRSLLKSLKNELMGRWKGYHLSMDPATISNWWMRLH